MLKLLRKILLVVMTVLCGIMALGTIIMFDNATIINNTLEIQTFEIVNEDVDPDADTQYIKSDFESADAKTAFGKETARRVVAEGSVLLKNTNNALPLAKNTKVTLMGTN